MATSCRQVELTGHHVATREQLSLGSLGRWLRLAAATAASIGLTFPPLAGAEATHANVTELRPFEAIYSTRAIGMTLDLTRTLTREDDVYRLQSSGENFLIKMKEFAEFRVTHSGVEGIRFNSKVKTLKTTKRAVEFDTERKLIKSFKRGEWTEHPFAPDVLDQFSQQQQLRLTLMQSNQTPETLQFRVVDGAKISDKVWRRLPNETLQTPLGDIDTVHYQAVHKNPSKRASEIWLAPSLDFLMVKTKHVERTSTIKVDIKSLKWLGHSELSATDLDWDVNRESSR